MKSFDYEKAWQDLALPQFKQLAPAVIQLLADTTAAAKDLSQLRDCSMPWPEDGGKLKSQFEALDSETLSRAAHVVHDYGHWRPGASIAGDAPASGEHWKFAHYADQVLRVRLSISKDSQERISFQIHEGTIRICYSSSESWLWHEVAPATEAGLKAANEIAMQLRRKIASTLNRNERESVVYKFMEELKKVVAWPDFDTTSYMAEESEIELRRAARMPKPDKTALRQKVIDDCAEAIANKTKSEQTERDAHLWLIDHDLPIDNCIYYNHTGRFFFGWRKPYTGTAHNEILKALAEFPFPYDVKHLVA